MSKDLFKSEILKNIAGIVHICDKDKTGGEEFIGNIDADYAEEIIFKKDVKGLLEATKEYRDMLDCPDGAKHSKKLQKKLQELNEIIAKAEGDTNE